MTCRIVIGIALAGLLAASVRAEELVPPEIGGCTAGTARGVYTGQKISLDFRDADIVNVIRILSEVGRLNIVITDDVKGRITLRLVDVPWDQAFDVVLRTNGLECVEIGNARRVSSVERGLEERETRLAAGQAAEELEPLRTATIRVEYLPAGR